MCDCYPDCLDTGDRTPEEMAREAYYWNNVEIDDEGNITKEPDMSKFEFKGVDEK